MISNPGDKGVSLCECVCLVWYGNVIIGFMFTGCDVNRMIGTVGLTIYSVKGRLLPEHLTQHPNHHLIYYIDGVLLTPQTLPLIPEFSVLLGQLFAPSATGFGSANISVHIFTVTNAFVLSSSPVVSAIANQNYFPIVTN